MDLGPMVGTQPQARAGGGVTQLGDTKFTERHVMSADRDRAFPDFSFTLPFVDSRPVENGILQRPVFALRLGQRGGYILGPNPLLVALIANLGGEIQAATKQRRQDLERIGSAGRQLQHFEQPAKFDLAQLFASQGVFD
ncbi:hypothetical protein CKO29_15185 [Allochromatium vinosum]|nr:hypothetical protein [Allochromatium vinosum]